MYDFKRKKLIVKLPWATQLERHRFKKVEVSFTRKTNVFQLKFFTIKKCYAYSYKILFFILLLR